MAIKMVDFWMGFNDDKLKVTLKKGGEDS